ncbi:MAG: hypothetical protein ACLUFK_08270, partial [Oscillospiraceae bacterium]
AERRLARSDENLLRVNVKIDELERQVGPLKQQAEVAKRDLALRDELRVEEVSAWMDALDRLREQSQAIANDYETAKSGLDAARRELEALYSRSEALAERMRRRTRPSSGRASPRRRPGSPRRRPRPPCCATA